VYSGSYIVLVIILLLKHIVPGCSYFRIPSVQWCCLFSKHPAFEIGK